MPKSRFNGAGYYLNDDRNSGGGKVEDDVILCGHCQAVLKKSQWLQDGGYCSSCDGSLCAACAKPLAHGGICISFKKLIDQQLNVKYHVEQNRKILGI